MLLSQLHSQQGSWNILACPPGIIIPDPLSGSLIEVLRKREGGREGSILFEAFKKLLSVILRLSLPRGGRQGLTFVANDKSSIIFTTFL